MDRRTKASRPEPDASWKLLPLVQIFCAENGVSYGPGEDTARPHAGGGGCPAGYGDPLKAGLALR